MGDCSPVTSPLTTSPAFPLLSEHNSCCIDDLCQFLGADNGGEEEEEEIQDEGLTDVDNIAIALGLGLTTFIVVSMAVLLYRAEKRRRHAKYMQKWRITVKGRVSSY